MSRFPLHTVHFEDESRLSVCRRNLFAFLSLTLLVALTYSNSFHASWHLDDGPNIVENIRLHVKDLSWAEVRKTFVSTPAGSKIEFFRPLSRFSLALNYFLGGDEVFGYHLVNVFIHVIASLFLYLFLYRTFQLPLLRARYGQYSHSIALLATSLWAVHPIQTQAVTYIVQRMTSMGGMFFIMALYFYVRALGESSKMMKTFFGASCAMTGLMALGSKENAVLLPLNLFLYHLLLVQGLTARAAKKTLTSLFLAYVLPVCAVLAYLIIQYDAVSQVFDLYAGRPYTPWERLLTETRVVILYIGLLLYPLPSRFSPDHDISLSTSLFAPPTTFLAIMLILGLLVAGLLVSRREPILAFCVFFFFLNHSVESSILPLELVFEHRNYVPSMMFFVPIAIWLLKAILRLREKRFTQTLVVFSVGLMLAAVAHSAYLRNRTWKDEGSLWLECLRYNPSSFRAHHNLGRYFSLQGDDRKAFFHYGQALKSPGIHTRKEKGITFFNLGLIAHNRGDYSQAFSYYVRALETDPCCPGAHNNLAALILGREGMNPFEVLGMLEKALDCGNDTELPLAHGNMGIILFRVGRAREGLEHLISSIEMQPKSPLNLLRLGYVLKETGRYGRASTVLRRALEVDPRNPAAFLCLAEVYLRSGHTDQGRGVLARMLHTVSSEELEQYLGGLTKQPTLVDVIPDMRLLLPSMEEACRERNAALQRVLDRCRHISERMGEKGIGTQRNEKETGR